MVELQTNKGKELVFYNNKIKHQFLQYCASIQKKDTNNAEKIESKIIFKTNVVSAFFLKIKRFEEKLNKDIVNMNFSEINNIVKQLDISLIYFRQYKLIYRAYLNWCLNENLTHTRLNFLDCVDYEEVALKKENINTYYCNKYFKDSFAINTFLNRHFPRLEYDTMHNCIRVVIIFLYLGVEMDDIIALPKKNVDLDRTEIYYKDKIIKIPNEFIEQIVYYNDMSVFKIYPKGNYDSYGRTKRKNPEFNPYFFDSGAENITPQDENWVQNIKKRMINMLNHRKIEINKYYSNINFTFSSTWESGVFSRVYQKETLLNTQFDKKQLASSILNEMIFDFDVLENPTVALKARVRRLQNIYPKWKDFYYNMDNQDNSN